MKKLLRKWLEVPELSDMSGYVNTNDVKTMVEDAIVEAFGHKTYSSLNSYGWWDREPHKNITGTLDESVTKIVHGLIKPKANVAVSARLKELTEPESFIDGVVERIKAKQL